MTDPIEEELRHLSAGEPKAATLSSKVFSEPLASLIQKHAISVEENASVADAVSLMREHQFGAVLVTKQGKLSGIVTERDLVTKVVGVVDEFLQLPVSEIMTRDPVALHREDATVHVMHNMHVGGYRHVPIVDEDGRPLSVISIKDVLRYILDYFRDDVVNTLPEPYRGPPRRWGG